MNHNTYNAGLQAGSKVRATVLKGSAATTKVAGKGASAVAGFSRGLFAPQRIKSAKKFNRPVIDIK